MIIVKNVSDQKMTKLSAFGKGTMVHYCLYNNKINARVLIGQSAMVYCAGKPMEKSRVF